MAAIQWEFKGAVHAKRQYGPPGEFEVLIDGDVVFTKSQVGRFPDEDEILDEIRDRLKV